MQTSDTTAANEMAPDATERLIGELRGYGVTYLSGGRTLAASAAAPVRPPELLRRLAVCADARVRDATIALLLLHPAIIGEVAADHELSETAITLLLAATYLQATWRTRLTLAIGPRAMALYGGWSARALPAPWRDDGEVGLRALAAYERRRVGHAYNLLAAWNTQVDRLCAQAWSARRTERRAHDLPSDAATRPPHATAPDLPTSARPLSRMQPGARGLWHSPRGGAAMSMREPVDKARITLFLERLGERTHQPGRLYLAGGTTMVYEGYRRATLDIDVMVEADDTGPIIASIRDLKNQLDINVEFASPADFIPLPPGWRERSLWVGRFGALDVFHFDLYSAALSKIERGSERDFQDTLALLRDGRIDLATLDQEFDAILPRIQTEGLAGMDADVFAAHYQELRRQLGAAEPPGSMGKAMTSGR